MDQVLLLIARSGFIMPDTVFYSNVLQRSVVLENSKMETVSLEMYTAINGKPLVFNKRLMESLHVRMKMAVAQKREITKIKNIVDGLLA